MNAIEQPLNNNEVKKAPPLPFDDDAFAKIFDVPKQSAEQAAENATRNRLMNEGLDELNEVIRKDPEVAKKAAQVARAQELAEINRINAEIAQMKKAA